MDGDIGLDLDHGRRIWLTEVSKKTFEEQRPALLEHDSGLFVVLEDLYGGTFEILAKAASISAGMALLELVAETSRPGRPNRPGLSLIKG